jgi:hypothetical protein
MSDKSQQLAETFALITADPRYKEGIAYGKPRTGHPEGRVVDHIKQLDANLDKLVPLLSSEEFFKLRILIHVHDSFKHVAKRDSAIEDPWSHASLAREFLAEFSDDEDLLRMVQYHDLGFALWKQFEAKGKYSYDRLESSILSRMQDVELFLLFTIIDGFTPGKDHTKIRWFIDEVNKYRKTPRAYEAMAIFGI